MKRTTIAAIRAERLRREQERRREFRDNFSISNDNGFWEFCKYVAPDFFNDKKIPLKKIAYILQKVAQGKIKKVIISIMPRVGKSYIVSLWCVWMLGHNPEGAIMRNTYGAKLANKFSRDIRAFIGVPGAQKSDAQKKVVEIFPHLKLSKDKRAVEEWALETAKDVSYFCSGIDGAVTGYGCNLAAIMDDPIKSFKDATPSNLEAAAEWYESVHRSRFELNSDCPEIIIMTRWTKGDLADVMLSTEAGTWEEVILPALIKKKGKSVSFCEDIVTTEKLIEIYERLKDKGLLYLWLSLYMCNPTAKGGLLYPIESLKRFKLSELNRCDVTYGYIDFADSGTDYLASGIVKVVGKDVYLVNVVFTNKDIDFTEPEIVKQYIEYKPTLAIFESNAGGKIFAKMIQRTLEAIPSVYTVIDTIFSGGNKDVRIKGWAGVVLKHFHFLDDTEYLPDSDYDLFIKDLTEYKIAGNNVHDDSADMVAGLAQMIQGGEMDADIEVRLI